MQHLQPNTTLQGGKYRIERSWGKEVYKRMNLLKIHKTTT